MKKIFLTTIICALGFLTLQAQDKEKPNSAAQANNPLAKMTAFSLQNYYVPKLTDASDASYMNTSWVRFAKPLAKGKLLLRVSAPISTIAVPTGTGSVESYNGLGDVSAFMSYAIVSTPTTTIGIGPQVAAPTATRSILGSETWQGGVAVVAFVAKSPIFQYGGLLTWQTSFSDNDDGVGTNVGAVQPFYFFQLGKGTYLRGAPIWYFDFENDNYHVPMALGMGKIVKINNTVFNFYVEPQYSMLHKGSQPQLQIFTGINIQLL